MLRGRRLALVLLVAIGATPLVAQEPLPARLDPGAFDFAGNVPLQYAWRFAPGDDPARAAAVFDDAHWVPLRPALAPGDLPPDGWTGVGWFRRHLVLAPAMQGRPLVVRLSAPGSARLFVDGRPLVAVDATARGASIARPGIDSAVVRLAGRDHVLAVRYAYPVAAPRPAKGFGFELLLTDTTIASPGPWLLVMRGATLALPIVLALIHLAFFGFDPRGRENLFFALEMLTFAAIVFTDSRMVLLSDAIARQRVAAAAHGLAILAIAFGGLTFYALRTRPWPRSARAFAVLGAALFLLSYALPRIEQPLWIGYFVVLTADIVRLERTGRTAHVEGARFFTISFAIFGAIIVLQVLINLDVIASVAGMRDVYVLGILVLATGMSLYLASSLGRSRVQEAENARKTAELARARDLQLSLLPSELPAVAGLDLAAVTRTATEVGGDYYDARRRGDGALLLAFGDATGHGLAAGLVVTATKALFGALPDNGSPAAMLATCKEALRSMRLPQLRMCLSLAVLSPRGITLASAAMPPALVWRARDGAVEELGQGGLPLGGRAPVRYEERATALAPGDVLLLASDGFAELRDGEGRQLGYDGVATALRAAAPAASAGEIVDRLLATAERARGGHAADDDLTLLVARVV